MPKREGKEHPRTQQLGQSTRGCPAKGSHLEEWPADVWGRDMSRLYKAKTAELPSGSGNLLAAEPESATRRLEKTSNQTPVAQPPY
ncbi:MAG: hypothetical protein KME26_01060 [Oscillatoria princeps RMCB-10]|nr:hypothetical protein [Oscillatoria princeps RMCB-10]